MTARITKTKLLSHVGENPQHLRYSDDRGLGGSALNAYMLTFEGRLIPTEHGWCPAKDEHSRKPTHIEIRSLDLFNRIISYPISEILEDYSCLEYTARSLRESKRISIDLKETCFGDVYIAKGSPIGDPLSSSSFQHRLQGKILEFRDDMYYIGFKIHVDAYSWKNSWSSEDHVKMLAEAMNGKMGFDIARFDEKISRFYDSSVLLIAEYTTDDDAPLKSFVDEFMQELSEAQSRIFQIHSEKQVESLVENRFSFPEEVKTACKQYLLYFTEFLQEIGIKANSRIEDNDEYVNFFVEPQNKDKERVLSDISELLKIYLQLPASPTIDSYPNNLDSSLVAQKYLSQIHYLKSQLAMANAVLQLKDATINMQSLTNTEQQAQFSQRQVFTPDILIESIQMPDESGEDVLGGLVTIQKYRIGPFDLNIPEVIRRLKAIYKRGNE